MKKEETRRRTVWIPDGLWNAMKKAASLEDRTVSWFIRHSVAKAIGENERPPIVEN